MCEHIYDMLKNEIKMGCNCNSNLDNRKYNGLPDIFLTSWDPTLGRALGYFSGGYVLPRTPNWHPVLKKISPKIDTPF